MLSTDPIDKLINELPDTSLTTRVLGALDFVVPGEWENLTGWDATVAAASEETDPARLAAISQRAKAIYADPSRGYQRAAWIYQAVDTSDKAVAAAVLASKAGEKIGFLSFLERFTPKSDTTQAVDLALKVAAEAMAFAALEGMPEGGIKAFGGSLADYGRENAMRMAAIICLDGLLPLGPDFLEKGIAATKSGAGAVGNSRLFDALGDALPGMDEGSRLAFVGEAFAGAKAWMSDFTAEKGLTQDRVLSTLKDVMEISDDKLDYVGAFFDATTNYFAHTGLQTVAHMLIEEAADELDEDFADSSTQDVPPPLPDAGDGADEGTSKTKVAAGVAGVAAAAGLGYAAYKHFTGDDEADTAVYEADAEDYEALADGAGDLQATHQTELASMRDQHFAERQAMQARGPRYLEMMERHRSEVEGARGRQAGERQARGGGPRGGGPRGGGGRRGGPGGRGQGRFRARGRGPGGGRGPARRVRGRGMGGRGGRGGGGGRGGRGGGGRGRG